MKGHRRVLVGFYLIIYVIVIISQHSSPIRLLATSEHIEIADATSKLSAQLSKYAQLDASTRTQLQSIAKARKELLLQVFEHDPRAFLVEATLADEYASLAPAAQVELRDFIERPVHTDGTLIHLHGDNFDAGKSLEQDLFTSHADGKTYHVRRVDSAAIEGAEVRIEGVVLADDMVISSIQSEQTAEVTAASITNGGNLRTVVLVFEFADSQQSERNFTIDDVRQRIFTAPDSVKNFIEQTSYYVSGSRGVTLSGDPINDVYGWFKISNTKPISTNECNITTYAQSAELAAKSLYADVATKLSTYERIIYIWPRQNNCYSSLVEGPWNGWAELPGRKTWINGMITTRTFAHELGHNFGLSHSISISCPKPNPSRAIDYYDTCRLPKDGGTGVSNYEYGDKYDAMGSGGKSQANGDISYTTAAHFNARYKMKLGWLSSSRQKAITAATTNIRLLPLENFSSSGYQVIRIPKLIGTATETFSSDYYYVEYRTPRNVDSLWPITAYPAGQLIIHIYGNTKYLTSSGKAAITLVDAIAPFDANFDDAALHLGNDATDTFYDQINKVKIRLLSANGSSATVCVDINDTGICGGTSGSTPTPSPTPTSTPTATPVLSDSATPTPTPPTESSIIVTIVADADTYVDQSKPTSNFGTSSSLIINGNSNPAKDTYIRFQVSNIFGTVRRAILRVFTTTNGTNDGPAVYTTASSWIETGVTYNTRPARTSGVLADAGAIETETWVEYDVTSAVVENGTFSFNLTATSSDGAIFSSREASNPPQLVITYAP
jgi:hypothetical protein